MQEVWTSIDNYPGYLISNLGRVKKAKCEITYADGTKEFRDEIEIPVRLNDGKYCVNFQRKTHQIHRLVASAFLDHESDCNVVKFKDGDTSNYCSDNLEWITVSESAKNAINSGKRSCPIPYTGKKLRCIETSEEFKAIKKLAEKLNLSTYKITKALKSDGKIGQYHYEYIS